MAIRLQLVILLLLVFVISSKAQDSILVVDSSLIKKNLASADSHYITAVQLLTKNSVEAAFAHLYAAESLYKQAANPNGQSQVYQAFGDYYSLNYVWKKAQSSYQKALEVLDVEEFAMKGALYSKLANAYLQQQNTDEAAKNYSAAIAQFDKADLNAYSADSYVSLAGVRRLQKKFSDSEFIIMRRALPIYRSAGFVPGRIGCFNVLGHIYRDQKRYSEAKWYFIQANTLARNLRDTVAITESLINLGNVKTDIADYKLALKDFKEAERLAKSLNMLKQLRDVNNSYVRLYKKTGNKMALSAAMEKYNKLKDSVDTLEQQKIRIADKIVPLAPVPKKAASTKASPQLKKKIGP